RPWSASFRSRGRVPNLPARTWRDSHVPLRWIEGSFGSHTDGSAPLDGPLEPAGGGQDPERVQGQHLVRAGGAPVDRLDAGAGPAASPVGAVNGPGPVGPAGAIHEVDGVGGPGISDQPEWDQLHQGLYDVVMPVPGISEPQPGGVADLTRSMR